jgi:hypothetical protein
MQVTAIKYELIYPPDFADLEPMITAKGWFAAAVIIAGGRLYRPVFYDLVRLDQEVADALAAGNWAFVERNLVIVHEITRTTISAAVDQLARRGFVDLVADDLDQYDS